MDIRVAGAGWFEAVECVGRFLDRSLGAVRSCHCAEWRDAESKITVTTVIKGLLIALRRSLPALDGLGFTEYRDLAAPWTVDFSEAGFTLTSSQYGRFSQDVQRNVFGIVEVDKIWQMP